MSGSIFVGIRRILSAGLIGMKNEGLFWFLDLTSRDSYFILPCLTGGVLYHVMRYGIKPDFGEMLMIHSINSDPGHTHCNQWLLLLLIIPLMATMPAGINFHYLISTTIAMVHTKLIHFKTINMLYRLLNKLIQVNFRPVFNVSLFTKSR